MGLAGTSTDILVRTLWSQHNVSLTLLNNTPRPLNESSVSRKFQYRLPFFIVIASSSRDLFETLKGIKTSAWWNHMATFLILSRSLSLTYDCTDTFEILSTAWEMNLLNAKHLCLHQTKGLLIYDYNPYKVYAPDPWKLQNTYMVKDNHIWSLFVRTYRDDEKNCENLDFDKTRDLGGYEIRSTVKDIADSWHTDFNKTGTESFGDINGEIAKLLFRALNATPKLKLHNRTDTIGFLNIKGKSEDFMTEVDRGVTDIGLIPRYQLIVENFTTTYPHWQSEISIITQYSGYASQIQKILGVIDYKSKFGMFLVHVSVMIYFKFFVKQALIPAILDTSRYYFCQPLLYLPKDHARRIYLSSIFAFGITVQSLYTGQLSSLLTKKVPLRNVNIVSDIIDLDYTVYGYKAMAHYLYNPEIRKRFVGIDSFNCTAYVLQSSSAACIHDWRFIIQDAEKLNLHIAEESLKKTLWTYVVRPDWPIENKINVILSRLVEGHIIDYILMKEPRRSFNIHKFYKALNATSHFEVITLEELTFMFNFLGIGLIVATIIFIIEVGFPQARYILTLIN